MDGALVGRAAEARAVTDFLGSLESARGVLLIEGPAGIGKTALWLEAVHLAGEVGHQVLRTRAAPNDVSLSFTGLTDLFAAAFDQVRTELPRPQERALAVALLREEAPAAAVDARAVAAGALGLLTILAETAPVVLAIDDLAWLDAPSVRALEFAIRRLPPRVGVMVTARTADGPAHDEPVDLPQLVGLLPAAQVRRVGLMPLSVDELRRVLKGGVGERLPAPLLARVAEASGGNPLFAIELTRGLLSETGTRLPVEPLPVPPTLSALVSSRTDSLSTAALDLALVVAILNRATLGGVAAVLGKDVHASAALAEAERAGVLQSWRGLIEFTHPLLASEVLRAATGSQVRALHARAAEFATDPEERARHRARSAQTADEEVAMVVEEGATSAARRGAVDTAAELFEEAARLTPDHHADDAARRLLGQAAALNAVGDFSLASSLAERAVHLVQRSETRVAALTLLGSLTWYAGRADRARTLLEQALAVTGSDPALNAPTYAALVRFTFTADLEAAARRADEALRLIDREQHRRFVGHLLIDRFFAGALLAAPEPETVMSEGIRLEEEELESSTEAPHPIPLIWYACTDATELARARHEKEDGWYRARGEQIWRANRLAHLAPVELRAGHWDRAERYAEESAAVLESVNAQGPILLGLEKRAFVDAHLDRTDRARSTLEALISDFDATGQDYWALLALSTLGFTEYAAGRPADAVRALDRMHAIAGSSGVRDIVHDRSEPFQIECLLELGEVDRAEAALRRLERRGEILPRQWITVCLPRARALVLAAHNDVAAALAALDELDPRAAAALPFDLGCTLVVRGILLRRMRQKRAAVNELERALAIFEHLGGHHWAERARTEIRRVGTRQPSGGLTESERRVAELAASGATNRTVAASLNMSPKTVEATLAKVYRKLGIHSRAELGAAVAGAHRSKLQT